MVELSKKKIEVAQELSKATEELDFASEVEGSRNAFLEARKELELILKKMVEVEESLENFY